MKKPAGGGLFHRLAWKELAGSDVLPWSSSVMMAHRCRTQRLGSLRTDHFDDLHHAQILMIQDMAVHHECADIVLVLRVDVELLPRRNQHGILPHRLRGTTRPLAFHL